MESLRVLAPALALGALLVSLLPHLADETPAPVAEQVHAIRQALLLSGIVSGPPAHAYRQHTTVSGPFARAFTSSRPRT